MLLTQIGDTRRSRGTTMHTFETTDIKVARRFRSKQFKGESAAFSLAGTIIVGLVKSVSEHKASVPACWTITIVPKTPTARQPALRATLHEFY
jgi:hypothetical protein